MQKDGIGKMSPLVLESAVTKTQVADGFFIKRTPNAAASIAYLVVMTRVIDEMYLAR